MKKILAISILTIMFINPGHAQDSKLIEEVISSLFVGMKTKNPELVSPAFHPEAIMHTVVSGESGGTLGSNSVQDFINRIATTPENIVLDERILEYDIKIDGQMAAVWTPYEFYVNDTLSHCGVNSFQMIKTPEGWKITYIIDTRRKDKCK
ncbi:nuclear transport factor 2 family protein [Shivajiella indica]|uniref:Nuclear transport factor 2 family protein n=1 Tax=Shivajiella indica TaxID=872115 RepID=A0ABW5BBL2_9BACT